MLTGESRHNVAVVVVVSILYPRADIIRVESDRTSRLPWAKIDDVDIVCLDLFFGTLNGWKERY